MHSSVEKHESVFKMFLLASTVILVASFFVCPANCKRHASGKTANCTYLSFQKIPPMNVTAQRMLSFFLNPSSPRGADNRLRRQASPMFNVVYLVDSSRSIRRRDFKKGLRAVKLLTRKARRDSNLFAAITFSTDAEVSFNFTNQRDAEEKLGKLPYMRGKTNTQLALEKCKTELLENPNSGQLAEGQSKVLIVTDGQSNVKSELTLSKALTLKQLKIEIFVVAVGYHIHGMQELVGLASAGDTHMYRVQDMRSFIDIVKLIPPVRYQHDAVKP